MTENSTVSLSSFHRASSGNVKNIAPSGARGYVLYSFYHTGVGRASRGRTMPTQGERIAGFILITGIDGIRYALRQHAVSVVSDLAPAHGEPLIRRRAG